MRGAIGAGLLAIAVMLASPAGAQRVGVGLALGAGGNAGSGGGAPSLGNLSGSATATAPAGTAVVTPTVANLTGCTWSLAAQANFAQASSGAVKTAIANVPAGSYAPATTCSLTASGQTISVSAPLAITINGAAFTNSLDHSDARNSFYL